MLFTKRSKQRQQHKVCWHRAAGQQSGAVTLLQVPLNSTRSFYQEGQKTPFPHLPWKTGRMHFHFHRVSHHAGSVPQPWQLTAAVLHTEQRTLCPSKQVWGMQQDPAHLLKHAAAGLACWHSLTTAWCAAALLLAPAAGGGSFAIFVCCFWCCCCCCCRQMMWSGSTAWRPCKLSGATWLWWGWCTAPWQKTWGLLWRSSLAAAGAGGSDAANTKWHVRTIPSVCLLSQLTPYAARASMACMGLELCSCWVYFQLLRHVRGSLHMQTCWPCAVNLPSCS